MNQNNKSVHPYEDYSFDGLRNYDTTRLCICYKLINMKRNKQLLDSIPYIPFMDLAIVFYVPFADDDCQMHIINITNAMLRIWGVDVSRLYADAHRNTARFLPGMIKSLTAFLNETSSEKEIPELNLPLYVISNRMNMFGASVILYDGFLQASASLLEDDLIVLPSSINDMLLIPASTVPEPVSLIQDMVVFVNQTAVTADKVLSNNIYYYSRSDGGLKII